MGTSSTVNASDGRTQVRTYTGLTTEQTQDAFEADRAEAKRQGWIAVSQRWDTSQPIPTLIIEYRHWSGPKRRARSRWPAIGAVALAVVVMLVMASATDREQDPGESGATAEPEPPPQPASVADPDRASAPGLEWTLPARPSGLAGRLRPAWTPRPAKPTPGEYEQTWTRPYRDTTCRHWANKMDEHQRFVAAADFLVIAQGRTGSLPPDRQITKYRRAITQMCRGKAVASMPIAEAAAATYLISSDLKP